MPPGPARRVVRDKVELLTFRFQADVRPPDQQRAYRCRTHVARCAIGAQSRTITRSHTCCITCASAGLRSRTRGTRAGNPLAKAAKPRLIDGFMPKV